MKFKSLSLLICFVFIYSSLVFARAKIIGKFTKTEGGVLLNTKKISKNPRKGTKVYEGDTVITGQLARAQVTLKDGAVITLGENTNFKFDEYNFQAKKQKGNSLFSIMSGAFSAVTGKIMKMKNKSFKIKTPVAVISVKGTTFWGGFWKSGVFDITLLEGNSVLVENKLGKQEITKVGDGVSIANGGGAPTAPKTWSKKKIEEVKNTVKFSKK